MGAAMASLIIRNLDESLKAELRLQAAQHGWSMEQEAREILRATLTATAPSGSFADRMQQRFSRYEIDELPIPPRQPQRTPPSFEG